MPQSPATDLNPGESIWDSCEDLTVVNPTYAQLVWDPKATRSSRIGVVAVSTEQRAEGRGSIRWVVTHGDVQQALKENVDFWIAALHKLYGQDWSAYVELSLHIQCDSPKHPPLYCQLIGAKVPLIRLLDRDEVTDGWKDVRWDLRTADIGESDKYGPIMNYVRFYALADDLQEGDRLDVYIDNMRLTTEAPTERPGT